MTHLTTLWYQSHDLDFELWEAQAEWARGQGHLDDLQAFDPAEAQAEYLSALPLIETKPFSAIGIGDEFLSDGIPYRKLEPANIARYGNVNAIALDQTGIFYEGDTGHRFFYDDQPMAVVH